MFLEILKDDTYQTLIDEINNCGYSIHELSDISSVSKKDIKKIKNGNLDDMDFLMLVNLCKAMDINPFSFIKEGISLVDFLNSI